MKTSLISKSLLVLGAFAIITTVTLAGPGPQYWAKRPATNTPAANTPKSESPAAMACNGCKSTPVLEFVSSLPNGKGTPRWTVVGSKHECGGCGGAVTTIRGKTVDTMDRASSACAKSGMSCCK